MLAAQSSGMRGAAEVSFRGMWNSVSVAIFRNVSSLGSKGCQQDDLALKDV